MEEDITKVCLIEGHENDFLTSICLDKQCKIGSRTICQDCLCDPKYSHRDCKVFLKIGAKDKIKFHYQNSTDIQKVLEEIEQYEEENNKLIDIEFEKLSINIVSQLNLIRKQKKLELYEQYREMKEEIKNSLNAQSQLNRCYDLKECIKNFKQKSLNLQGINKLLVEKQKQSINSYDLETLINNYKIMKPYPLTTQYFEEINDKLENSLKQINQNLYPIQKISGNSQIQIIPLKDYENYIKLEQNGIIKVSQYSQFRSINKFKRDQIIKFSFQIIFDQTGNQNLFLGMYYHTKQIRLFENDFLTYTGLYNNRGKNFITKTGVHLNEVFKYGQIYDVEICLAQNRFQISDQEKISIMESNHQFDQSKEDWSIFFTIYPGIQLKLI